MKPPYIFSRQQQDQINIDYMHYLSVVFNTVKNKKNYSLGAVRLESELKKNILLSNNNSI